MTRTPRRCATARRPPRSGLCLSRRVCAPKVWLDLLNKYEKTAVNPLGFLSHDRFTLTVIEAAALKVMLRCCDEFRVCLLVSRAHWHA